MLYNVFLYIYRKEISMFRVILAAIEILFLE